MRERPSLAAESPSTHNPPVEPHRLEEGMPPSETARGSAPEPVVSLDDPRVVQILATEHWSLLASRSLAYNEAFTRGGMFLTFLSTSFVALALLAQGMSYGQDFLTVAAVVLAFDLVIGLATYGRINGANVDDLRAVHGMARIRHGYTEIAPIVAPYFTSATNDDPASVVSAYGSPSSSGLGLVVYGLTTSGGMIGLITSMVGGVFAAVLGLIFGVSGALAVWIGVGGAVLVFAVLLLLTAGSVPRHQDAMTVLFPARAGEPGAERRTTD
jgi:FtsH-binding integral membrane protein